MRAATEAVAVALEIVDSRIADWKLTLRDTVADNASSGAVVLGEWVPYTDGHRSRRVRGRRCSSTGPRSTPVWDRRCSAIRQRRWPGWPTLSPRSARIILPGQFVMSGSFTTAAFVHSGDTASATISGLGTVSLTFT